MKRRVPVLTLTLALALLPLTIAAPAAAEKPVSLGVGVGIFDTAAWFDDKGKFDAVEAGLVLRWSTGFWGIGPIAGLSATEDSAVWGYVGARRPFGLGSGWELGPTFAFTLYDKGDGKDLGNELEFRSGLELNRRLANGATLGVEYYHLSNASISDVNPGSNSLWVVYAVPLGR